MEKNLANKMSLYDILTLLVPGSMVVSVLYIGVYPWIKVLDLSWIVGVATLGVMFLIGLLLKNWALENEKRIFNHNTDEIQAVYAKFAKETSHTLEEKQLTYDDYCKDYYHAIDANVNSKVSILETQVAFLRTMRYTMKVLFILCLIVFIEYIILFIIENKELENGQKCINCAISVIHFIGMIICGWGGFFNLFINLAHNIQKKVYEGVIYDSYYHGGPIAEKINSTKQYHK